MPAAMLACLQALGQQSAMMDALHHYRHSGLVIASDIKLPEWEAFACAPDQADVRITLAEGRCTDCPTDGSVVVGETLRFAVEGVGAWQVEGGHTIHIHPEPGADLPELRLFTLGSAWGGLGYQRGFAMWHGSAIEVDGRAILFCGAGGAGKSTMAAAMVKRGARLVSDDLSRIEPDGGKARIHPSSARIKLWSGAIEHLGWQDRVLQRDYFRDDKFHCSAPRHCAGEVPLDLAAIVSLEDADTVSLRRLAGSEAMEQAMRQTMYRAEMIEALGKWGEQGALGARISAACPIYLLERPKDFAALDEVCSLIDSVRSV